MCTQVADRVDGAELLQAAEEAGLGSSDDEVRMSDSESDMSDIQSDGEGAHSDSDADALSGSDDGEGEEDGGSGKTCAPFDTQAFATHTIQPHTHTRCYHKAM